MLPFKKTESYVTVLSRSTVLLVISLCFSLPDKSVWDLKGGVEEEVV